MANNYKISFQADIKNIKSIEQQITQLQKKINSVTSSNVSKSAKESAKAFQEMFKAQDSQTSKNYQKYYNDLAGGINNQTKSAKASANAFKELFATTQKGYTGLSEVSKKTVDLTGGMKTLAKGTMSFTDRVKEAVSSSIQWTIAMGGLYASIRKVREAIQTVIALDNQMTNIRMVTGASTQQAEEYLKTYEQIAEQTSSTTLEVAKSAETWLRQGRSIQETNALIKTSSVFAKVAFLDSAEAATLLTSAINGYGLSAEQAMGIVDKLSAIDVNAATGADDLARALRQTASSAKIAGVGMDDLLGFIATVSDVTQKSADSIGNSFKTIFARMQQVRLGALFDEDGESLSNVNTVLDQYGVALREVDGTFRDTSNVLDDLSKKWGTFNSAQKSEISTVIAGF